MGSASTQGQLWGAQATNWAEIQEGVCRPLFEAALDHLAVRPGVALLDVGCGAGLAAKLAARRGARVAGIDAAAALIAIAKERVPEADFRIGEMESLPFAGASFDCVTGFNSFQYAADPVNALREARRVAKAGASVVIATWGQPADCEAAVYLSALRPLLPAPPPGAPGPFALSKEGALEALAEQAGLAPKTAAEVDCLWAYPNLETALRGLLSAGPAVKAIETSGEDRVQQAVVKALAPFQTDAGGYELRNKFRYLVAAA